MDDMLEGLTVVASAAKRLETLSGSLQKLLGKKSVIDDAAAKAIVSELIADVTDLKLEVKAREVEIADLRESLREAHRLADVRSSIRFVEYGKPQGHPAEWAVQLTSELPGRPAMPCCAVCWETAGHLIPLRPSGLQAPTSCPVCYRAYRQSIAK